MENNISKKPLRMVSRNEIISLWEQKNIYGNNELDMAGILLDKKNVVSVHHIFGRGDNNRGLAVIGRLFHDYIDNYLLNNDTNEYVRWNNYLAKLYKYSIYPSKKSNKERLIMQCNALLCNMLKNKSERAQTFLERLKPYLSQRLSIYIVEAFENTKFTKEDFLPRSLLRGRKMAKQREISLLSIYQMDCRKTVDNYFRKKLKSYFKTNQGYTNLLYKIFPENIETLANSQKISTSNLNNKSMKILKDNSKPKHDWMGSLAYPEEIVEGENFITKTNEEVLNYLLINNQKIYDLWMKLFQEYKEGKKDIKKLNKKSLGLRKTTLNYIYDVLSQPGKLAIKNIILKDFNQMSDDERRKTYFEADSKYQLVIAFVILINNHHRSKIEKENKVRKLESDLSAKPLNQFIDKSQMNYDNTNFPIKNDEMGNDFSRDLVGEELPKDSNFLSRDSLHTLKLLKQNPALLLRWHQYLSYISYIRKLDNSFFDNKHRRHVMCKIYRKLYLLREETRKYFQQRLEETNCNSEKETCLYMINVYREKDIDFWIRYKSNEFNSIEVRTKYRKSLVSNILKGTVEKEVQQEIMKQKESELDSQNANKLKTLREEKISFDGTIQLTNDDYSTYVKDSYDRKFNSSFNTINIDTSILRNKTSESGYLVADKCFKDQMGLLPFPSSEEEINIPELIGIDIFLSDQSYYILKYLKENRPELFDRWVLLFKKAELNCLTEDEYFSEQFELLSETTSVLKRKYKKLEGLLRSGYVRANKSVYYMKRTRKIDM